MPAQSTAALAPFFGNDEECTDADAIQDHPATRVGEAVDFASINDKNGSYSSATAGFSARQSTLTGINDKALDDIVNVPVGVHAKTPHRTLHALQEWEGYVVEIGKDALTARLLDITAGATIALVEASIPLEEVAEVDLSKVVAGSIFRWVIGYEREGGTKKRVSHIVFRDLPAFTKDELLVAKKRALARLADFASDPDSP